MTFFGQQFSEKSKSNGKIGRKRNNTLLEPADLGNVLERQGRRGEAIAHFREALMSLPDDYITWTILGEAYASVQKTTEASRCFAEALRIAPASPEVHHRYGTFLKEQGRTDEAIAHFREALRLSPDYAEARKGLEDALSRSGAMP